MDQKTNEPSAVEEPTSLALKDIDFASQPDSESEFDAEDAENEPKVVRDV